MMSWFRSNVRSGAWCALFALTVQLALSFGHVHVQGGGRTGPASLAALAAPTGSAPISPADPNGASDHCDICALIQLASTASPSAAPSLPLPLVVTSVRFTADPDIDLAASRPRSFQARGPPLA
jgi:hypothetical protein